MKPYRLRTGWGEASLVGWGESTIGESGETHSQVPEGLDTNP